MNDIMLEQIYFEAKRQARQIAEFWKLNEKIERDIADAIQSCAQMAWHFLESENSGLLSAAVKVNLDPNNPPKEPIPKPKDGGTNF